jgi:hypothetical protein
MVWNNSPNKRSPLTTAVSSDGGHSWQHVKNLDYDGKHTFAYTSIAFLGDRVLFTYYFDGPGWSLKLNDVPVSWLYE